jgi:hypothetical protein
MPKYVFKVEQDIEVTADSYEKAMEELPNYPVTHGKVWEMLDETIGLLYKEEGASV